MIFRKKGNLIKNEILKTDDNVKQYFIAEPYLYMVKKPK